jgi:hypothetical protein
MTTAPRAVFVTRETDYDLLLARHATREQARFYLETRGQRLADLEKRHEQFQAVLRLARASVPADWRQALVRRADLERIPINLDRIRRRRSSWRIREAGRCRRVCR